jgi:hypothetical protein
VNTAEVNLVANLALYGVELLKAYNSVHTRLTEIAAGAPVTLADLPGFEAQTRAGLQVLKDRLDAKVPT